MKLINKELIDEFVKESTPNQRNSIISYIEQHPSVSFGVGIVTLFNDGLRCLYFYSLTIYDNYVYQINFDGSTTDLWQLDLTRRGTDITLDYEEIIYLWGSLVGYNNGSTMEIKI